MEKTIAYNLGDLVGDLEGLGLVIHAVLQVQVVQALVLLLARHTHSAVQLGVAAAFHRVRQVEHLMWYNKSSFGGYVS